MPTPDAIQLWFAVGSTYTYLTVARLPDIQARTGLSFDFRPFNVRAIMREQNNIPFATKPIKANYMWRDIERRAAMYGLPANVPVAYPLREFDLANCVAVIGREEGWCAEYVRATYRYWFVDGLEPGSEPNLSLSIVEAGQNPNRVIAAAKTAAIQAAYDAATDEARKLNIFGAPTLIVRGEVFWGDDRIEDAIDWYRNAKVS